MILKAPTTHQSKDGPRLDCAGSFHSLRSAQIIRVSNSSVAVRASELCAEVSVLADDLFRLRVARGRALSGEPSWAAAKADWAVEPPRVRRGRRSLSVQTTQGCLHFDLVKGAWELRDRFGLVLFSAPGGATGFEEERAVVAVRLDESESVFGLGESSGPFNKRGLVREFWNIDVGAHVEAIHAHLPNMYVSVPFGLSLRHGRAAGLFWDNPGRQTWDVGQTRLDLWQMSAASGEIDLYLFLGPTCGQVVERYTELTGRMPLPPRWSLGYQQCRYSYESRARVEEIARAFRRRSIPCDVIYLDIDYMDGYRVFTFGEQFPRPAEMIARLGKAGFKIVAIVDPGVKDDPSFGVLRRGLATRAFIKSPDGRKDYRGKVWPGRVRFPDFLNPGARAWWGREQSLFQRLGVAGFWNDMNEPADFSTPGKSLPNECLHQTDSGPVRHGPVHNLYGSQMARASYEGAVLARPQERPFIVTRAGYAGLQRFAAVWTGDNDSSWEHLADSVQMLLNLSLSGVAFCGADIGGFHHNTTGELLARWTQLAAFTPFFRNHSDHGTIPQEPWAFGGKIEAICRRYIELRYQLLPYLYGLFVQAHRSGTPIIRPLVWHYQNDPDAVAAGDQFLLGSDLLIAPILRPGATARSVYLPVGVWFDFWTGERFRGGRHLLAKADLDRLPLFVRAGAVIPFAPVRPFVGKKPESLVHLHVWPGAGTELAWFEDDGFSLDYERGVYHERTVKLTSTKNRRHLRFSPARGSLPSGVETWRVILRCAHRRAQVSLENRPVPAGFQRPLALSFFQVPNRAEAFELEWRSVVGGE